MKNFKVKILSVAKNNKNRLLIAILCCAILVAVLTGLTYATKNVTIIDGDVTSKVFTMSDDPYKILDKEKITLNLNDKIEVLDMDTKYPTIKISRAFNVFVKADNKTQMLKVVDATVEQVLKEAGIEINQNDIINFDLNKKVSCNDEIVLSRVTFEQRTENKPIEYTTKTLDSSDMLEGETKIDVVGENGNLETIYQDKYIDGVLIETNKISEKITKQPIEQVVLNGVKKQVKKNITSKPSGVVSISGTPTNYKKVFNGKATAYTSEVGARTATGRVAMFGHVAVNPEIIPYGSKLYIESSDGKYSYGYAIAADTGGALINGDVLVDLYFDTYQECIEFGTKNVNVYIVE